MIEPLAEAIAALVGVLVELIALMIEAMVWLVMMAFEIVVALWMQRTYTRPKLRRWRKAKGAQPS